MTTKETLTKIEEMLNGAPRIELELMDPRLDLMRDDLRKAPIRLELSRASIAIDFPSSGSTKIVIRKVNAAGGGAMPNPVSKTEQKTTVPTAAPKAKKSQHSYVVPKIAGDIISVLTDEASHVIWITGPTQCGKDRVVHYCGRELNRKVFQINCRGDMGSEVFFGEKTITVDPVTKQNVISFQKGLVEQALIEGLDENGKEVGQPGILFITEAAAMPAHIAIGINRLLESDDARRIFMIDQDGGRLVRGHSKMRIVLAANTIGRGNTGLESSAYSAQTDALDISLINRISVCFKMGYDKKVEKHILAEKIGDDMIASKLLLFRDAIRSYIKQGKLSSPFSTAHIVHIADMYRVFGDVEKAIYYVLFEFLLPEEKAKYNEQVVAQFGHDLLSRFVDKDVDYM
jgi:hypothetical protein